MTQFYPIRLVRMMTGELLVAGISDGGKETYILEKPMGIYAIPVQNQPVESKPITQEMTVILRDWIEFTNDIYFIVPKSSVMCIMRPSKDILSDYTQAKINSDILEDMIENGMIGGSKTVEDLVNEEDDDLETEPGEGEEYDEFPGWGGDPRL